MEDLHSMKITCPRCQQSTQSMKRCDIMTILFMVFGIARWTRTATLCPKCMRLNILVNAAFNILSANILWPFIILPMSLYQFACTFEAGHDSGVIEEIRHRLSRAPNSPAPSKLSKLGKL